MQQLKYIGFRIIKAIVLVLLIAVLNFLLVRLAPGDPASVIAGESGSADPLFMEQLRAQFRLDEPLYMQLWSYISGIMQFDLGFSYRNQETVFNLLMQRLPATLLLTSVAFVIALVGGVALGAVAATKVGRWPDSIISTMGVVLYAMPLFWIGLMLILTFSANLNWLPAFGIGSVKPLSGWDFYLDRFRHLVLPVMTLSTYYLAVYMRLARSSMLDVQGQDFVKLARAKGLPEGRIVRKHVLRNALLPVITFAGVQAGHLIGGSIVVETVFAWPGIGRLALESMLVRDYSTLLGVFFLCSIMTIVFNLITDLVYTIADPRIEVGT